jgi:hypothetical protein
LTAPVDAQYLVPGRQYSVAEVRPNEPRSHRYEHPLAIKHSTPDQSPHAVLADDDRVDDAV